jgi:hypothetical protein
MIVQRDASEEEMILEFLKAEFGRPLIDDADLSNAEENAKRSQMLDARRGYTSRTLIFKNFPRAVSWKYCTLTKEDFGSLRYVNSSPWRTLAGPDLRVVDGANHIRENTLDRTILDVVAPKVQAIAHSIAEGRHPDAALILAEIGDGRLIVLEGNHRATAFVLANTDRPVTALVGSSPEMVSWANQAWA